MAHPDGIEPPPCDCHGEPMLWAKDARKKAGGYWYCAVKKREHWRRWYEANPEKARESNRRWWEANPEKKRESNRRRVFCGESYLGKVATLKQAAELNAHVAMRLADFQAKQRGDYAEFVSRHSQREETEGA